jgi:tRNA (guanosine-2'-O-)-methyltransferase
MKETTPLNDTEAIRLRPAQETLIPDDQALQQQLCEYLAEFVSPKRLQRLEHVLAHRTRWITVALEEVYQTHNASAILRTCDCFGVQDVHIVDERNDYKIHHQIALGSAQWLDLYRHQGPGSEEAIRRCCASLKDRGYRLLATTPDKTATDLDDVDVSRGPMALLFGTELEGLTPQAMEHVDESIRIPMVGFTQSLNVSVSAALILRRLTARLRAEGGTDTSMDAAQRLQIRLRWLRRSMHHGEALIRRFLADHSIDVPDADPTPPAANVNLSGISQADFSGQQIVPDLPIELQQTDDTDQTDDEGAGHVTEGDEP